MGNLNSKNEGKSHKFIDSELFESMNVHYSNNSDFFDLNKGLKINLKKMSHFTSKSSYVSFKHQQSYCYADSVRFLKKISREGVLNLEFINIETLEAIRFDYKSENDRKKALKLHKKDTSKTRIDAKFDTKLRSPPKLPFISFYSNGKFQFSNQKGKKYFLSRVYERGRKIEHFNSLFDRSRNHILCFLSDVRDRVTVLDTKTRRVLLRLRLEHPKILLEVEKNDPQFSHHQLRMPKKMTLENLKDLYLIVSHQTNPNYGSVLTATDILYRDTKTITKWDFRVPEPFDKLIYAISLKRVNPIDIITEKQGRVFFGPKEQVLYLQIKKVNPGFFSKVKQILKIGYKFFSDLPSLIADQRNAKVKYLSDKFEDRILEISQSPNLKHFIVIGRTKICVYLVDNDLSKIAKIVMIEPGAKVFQLLSRINLIGAEEILKWKEEESKTCLIGRDNEWVSDDLYVLSWIFGHPPVRCYFSVLDFGKENFLE